ncbi:hypothetical protein HZH66_014322 [Vespula vulgaris]|uniref:Uncharacterized protein n=1 Tax=Vespula vulgaris TaxID=7454 RepID=A0A834J2M0_VESVU|nr:hypothetical protein HZH66_014322 [Vespula vulgaris]
MTLKNKLNQVDDVSFLLATLESGPAGCSRLIVEHGNSSFFDVLQEGSISLCNDPSASRKDEKVERVNSKDWKTMYQCTYYLHISSISDVTIFSIEVKYSTYYG